MMRTPILLSAIALAAMLRAQTTLPEPRIADFTTNPESNGHQFVPVFPPLQQLAGAPQAFYSCFWEFGDGDFSFEQNPTHTYSQPGNYSAILDLTSNYDNGKKPKKRKKSVLTGGGTKTAMAAVFPRDEKTAIALKTSSQPRAGEELTAIISYRNPGTLTTDGRIHLFFNEKKFPATHFRFDTARTYFGEIPDNSYTRTEPQAGEAYPDWASMLPGPAAGDAGRQPAELPGADKEEMLRRAREAYRGEQTWRFTQLRPGEIRNLFADLSGTANMLKDTSAFIHIEGIFEPFDPVIPAERFELEMEIVSSHDPNLIAVSDSRVNYRFIKKQQLDYKVRFQNNGEGPARTVELRVEVPEGLDMARMRPVDWHPHCPICPKAPAPGSCLDTATTRDGLLFTFRNVYLPGSRQQGVDDRDSTKGYVKYRIEPERDMPKRAFRSRASIVFDKNPPVLTNFSKTRFKPGLSPGLKAGYAFGNNAPVEGYFFAGVSLAPYKPWKIFPQIELLTGIKGKSNIPEKVFRDSTVVFDAAFKRVTYRDSSVSGQLGFVSFEVPVMLRKNFSRYVGAGLGGSMRILMADGEDRVLVVVTRQTIVQPGVPPQPTEILSIEGRTTPFSATYTRFQVFGELNLGFVRAGPALGLRAGAALDKKESAFFVQISAEIKF